MTQTQADALERRPVKVPWQVAPRPHFAVWSLHAAQSIEEAFRHAVAAGSAALLSAGTGLCKAEDMRRLYPQVHLQRL
jgi:6-phosphofructokinase 2